MAHRFCCEPFLAGNEAATLGITEFKQKQGTLIPVSIIDQDINGKIQSSLADFSHNFQGKGKLKNHQIKLHVTPEIKLIPL